ncbi:MAG: TIGR03545 family protein, partial [Ignavibacteriales bacterium]|nr:TIGR03545 family protein [Ignavibacteriales bacterium]
MRKKFVFVVLVPFITLCLILYLFLDQWVEAGLEAAGESAVGAKVEIDNLKLTLNPIGMEFTRLQVANARDPWKNMFETGHVKFALDLGQLLRNKYIIETMEVNELIFGTERATDGSLPKKPEPPPSGKTTEPSLAQQAETIAAEKKQSAPVFDLQKLRSELKIDSLLNVQNLRSVQHIEALKKQIQETAQQWQATLADIEKSKERLTQIEASVKAINVQNLKTIDQISSALKNANDAYIGTKQIHETYLRRQSSVTSDVNRLTGSIWTIDDLVREDFRRLLDLARLPDVSMGGLAEILLGKDILEKANEYLYWVEFTRTKVKNTTSSPDNAKPPRLQGQIIHFPAERSYPKFWIKKILVSGGTEKERNPNYFYARGEVLNIASNQKLTGFPTTADLAAMQGRGTKGTFQVSIDRTHDVPVDQYKATLSGIPVAAMPLGRSDFVPSKITNAQAGFALNVNVPGNQLDADANVTISGI